MAGYRRPNTFRLSGSFRPAEAEQDETPLTSNSTSDIEKIQTQSPSDTDIPLQDQPRSPSLEAGPPGPPGGWLSHSMSRPREIAFNLMICTIQLIPQACLTTCFPILQIIARSFRLQDPALLPWLIAAYALSFGTTILLAGRLGDIFGHKKMVVLGFCWLSVFSMLGGLSHYANYEVFFVSRALQGVGAAMMNPNALALLGRSYPPGSTGKIIAFSAFALCAPLGAYAGMLGSAIIGQLLFWPWAFYITAIVCACLAMMATFILPSPPKSPKQMLPFSQKLASMDWLGGLTGVAGLVCVQIALICAPSQGWSTQYIFMLLIVGLLLVAFFVVIELKVASEPLVPFKLLDSNVAFVLAAIACGWGTFGVWTFYLWKFLLNIWRDTPLLAALHVLPIVPVALIAAALTAFLMRNTRPAWILFWALVAFTLGPMFLALNHKNTIYWTFTFVSLVVTPFGMDMSFPSATFIMSNSLPMDKQGVAGSLVTTVVNYSISLGLGLASTVEVHVNNNGHDLMSGIRGGWFFGTGLGGLGIFICILFIIKTTIASHKTSVTQSGDSTTKTGEKRTPLESRNGKQVAVAIATNPIATNTTTAAGITTAPPSQAKLSRTSTLMLLPNTSEHSAHDTLASHTIEPIPPLPKLQLRRTSWDLDLPRR